MANVLCVMAHPDDEVLGCGGTLAKHAENGDKVHVAILGRAELAKEAKQAAEILSVSVAVGALPDQQFELLKFSSIVAAAEAKWDSFQPDVVYTHHPGDLNLDHALTARAVLTAFRPKPGEKPRTILACEVLSSTEYTYPRVFQPNWYVALTSEQIYKTVKALSCYRTEEEILPHPRSRGGIINRAAVRGSEVGVEHAEAFQLLRGGPF